MLFKTGSSTRILLDIKASTISPVKPSVTPSVTPGVKGDVTKIPQSVYSGKVVENLDKDNFLYFRARAISAGETSGPNGNGDFFPLEELVKSHKTFIGRGLFLNHESAQAEKAVGKIIDAYLITDNDTNEIWVETLCKIDRKANPAIARQVETGIIDAVSMGCNCESAICSFCNQIMHSRDEFCEHIRSGLLRKFMRGNEEILCYSINKGLTFSELSLVSMPADSKAKIHEVLASLKVKANFDDFKDFLLNRGAHLPEHKAEMDQLMDLPALKDYLVGDGYLDEKGWTDALEDFVSNSDRIANLKNNNSLEGSKMAEEKAEVTKTAGEVDSKQPALKMTTTKEEQTADRALEPGDTVAKAVEKVMTTKDEQDGVKNVLQKLNALEYLSLQDFLNKKAKDMGSEGDVKAIERHTDSEYAKGRGVADQKAKDAAPKPDEAALKDMAKDMAARKAAEDAALPKKATEVKAGKEGEGYGDEFPEKATGEEELAKMKKEVLRRVQSKLATRLFHHVLENEVNIVAGDPKKAAALLEAVGNELSKYAQAKPGSKEYYYWSGASEPKHTDIPTETDSMYRSEHQGEDVATVKPGKQQTADAVEQLADKDVKDEWSKAVDAKKKREESQNPVMKSRKSMGFGEAHSAEFKKSDMAKDSKWIVKTAKGESIVEFTLGEAWDSKLDTNLKWASSPEYGQALIDVANTEGHEALATRLNTKLLKTADEKNLPPWMKKKDESKKDEPKKEDKKDEPKKDGKPEPKKEDKAPSKPAKKGPELKPEQKKVMEKLEALESLLGVQEKPSDEEKEHEGKSFEDQVLMELDQIEAAAKKLAPKKEAPMGGPGGMDKKPPMPPMAPKKDEALPKPEGDKLMPKMPLASLSASAFDKGEPIVISEGISAAKDPESKMIVVTSKEGKEMARFPDAFGDDAASIIKMLGMVLGLEKKEAEVTPAPKEEKSDREKKLEAELYTERTRAAIREQSLKARAVIEDMLDKGLIQPDEDTVKAAQKDGVSILDSRKAGLQKAINDQMSNLFKMDPIAFESFAKSVNGLKKEAAQNDAVLKKAPMFPTDPLKMGGSDSEWLRNLPWS